MKALVLDKPGPPDTFHISEIGLPQPGNGEVRVKVEAVGLNPVDYKFAMQGHPAWKYPFVLGLDIAGTIDAVGSTVTNWQVGNRVVYHNDLSRPGGFAEYAISMAHVMTAVPTEVSFVEAAALPCAGYSAYQALFRKLYLREGQTILIHGGAGGVGGFAIQLAKRAGAMIITTCSDNNVEYVKKLGAHYVINYKKESIKDRVLKITDGRGVNAVVDTVSSESATASLDILAFGGGIACIAGMLDCTKIIPFTKAPSIHEIALGAAYGSGDLMAQKDLARMGAELMDLIHTRKVDPMVSEVISLDEVPVSLSLMAERRIRGKIVATIAG
jgi:NADPH:quinone reductase-like Zn-dependent oxidoreductase